MEKKVCSMEKKEWNSPQILKLDVENTEFGNQITSHPDAIFNDGRGHTFYSFS